MKYELVYDFYFSLADAQSQTASNSNRLFNGNQPVYKHAFTGIPYTDAIEHGKTPYTARIFKDLIKVGTGSLAMAGTIGYW